MLYINAKPGDKLNLGRKGENLARTILFDISQWRKLYGDGVVALLHQRAGDADPYPCDIQTDGNTVAWEITNADTAVASQYGKYELQYRVNDQLAKSAAGAASVYESLGESTAEPPEAQQGWVDKVLQAGAEAEAAAKRAEKAAIRQPYPNKDTGTWWIWNAEKGEYEDSGETYLGEGSGAASGTRGSGIWYGVTSTAEYTAEKVVTTVTGDFKLEKGARIGVKFLTNTVNCNSLIVDRTKLVYIRSINDEAGNSSTATPIVWHNKGQVQWFTYDGEYFIIDDAIRATASNNLCGKVSVSDSVSSEGDTVASSKAVKAAYDRAVAAQNAANGKLDASKLTNAVNDALAQAKESGEFDGDDYVLTDADKQEIAEQAAELVKPPEVDLSGYAKTEDIPTDEHINGLINTALAAIPNAAEVAY